MARAGPPLCKDRDAGCVDWAASGECERNAGFMRVACAASCDACGSSDGGPAAALPALPLNAPAPGVLRLRTSLGDIRIRLRPALAPRTTAYLRELAAASAAYDAPGGATGAQPCTACRFYRAEARPAPGAVDNFGGPGPPYALIQGSFASPSFAAIEREAAPLVERGDACLIGTGPDFFLAVGPHPEWGAGHTVFGRVVGGMRVVDAIAEGQPKHEETWGETHVTTLVTPLPFTLTLEELEADDPPGDDAPLFVAKAY